MTTGAPARSAPKWLVTLISRPRSLHALHPRSPSLPPSLRSRFTPWNFLPLFLLDAFQRLANFYFLIVCILQSIPDVSITNGVPTSFLPLGVVLLFDGFATAREDYKRHVDDDKANNSKSAGIFASRGRRLKDASVLTPPAPPPSLSLHARASKTLQRSLCATVYS